MWLDFSSNSARLKVWLSVMTSYLVVIQNIIKKTSKSSERLFDQTNKYVRLFPVLCLLVLCICSEPIKGEIKYIRRLVVFLNSSWTTVNTNIYLNLAYSLTMIHITTCFICLVGCKRWLNSPNPPSHHPRPYWTFIQYD